MKIMWMILFMLLPLLGFAYVFWHIWQLLPFSAWGKTGVVAIGLLALLCMFANFTRLRGMLSLDGATALYEVGNSTLFILLYLAMTFIVLDIGRLVRLVPRSLLYNNGTTALAITALLTVLFVYGNRHYNNKVRQPIALTTDKRLSRPLKLVMLSDLHLGYHNRRKEFARWVDLINKEKADAILIAGDIIDISTEPLEQEETWREFLRLNAPVYACLGNHEYYSGQPNAQLFYRMADICLLRDSTAMFDNICIIGRDDRTNPARKSVAELARMAPDSAYTIVLDHQPYHLERTEKAAIDFQFSGHTHHGQVWPISWITQAIYECAFGPHQRGNTRYYVSSGMGIWGGKFRIGTRSEYIVATVTSTAATEHPQNCSRE